MSYQHTPVCNAQALALDIAQKAYAAAWPSFCRHCGGTGQVDDSDPSVGMYAWAPCPECTELSFCPRCREYLIGDVTFHAWVEGDAEHYQCPACGLALGEDPGYPTTDVDCVCCPECGGDVWVVREHWSGDGWGSHDEACPVCRPDAYPDPDACAEHPAGCGSRPHIRFAEAP